MQALILVYARFDSDPPPFVLQTDASLVGVSAVLEQGGKVVAYASRALMKAERQYNVIQRECLAAVYGMKQFCHYLLGRPFKLITDHAPLQCTKNGGSALPMVLGNSGVQLYNSIPEGITECKHRCIIQVHY